MLGLLAATSGCRCDKGQAPADPSALSASASAASVRVPSLAPGYPSDPAPMAADPLWKQAAAGDPLDLQRLANREGALGLLEGLEAGGTLARTALAALPYAPDGELGLARLCELLPHLETAEHLALVLSAAHGIISRPPRQAERLELQGYRACAPVLEALQTRSDIPAGSRDLAASARAMLAEHGVR
jgi:hypothetical protein